MNASASLGSLVEEGGSSGSQPAVPSSVPKFDEILWDYRVRTVFGERIHWKLTFGAAQTTHGRMMISSKSTEKAPMRVTLEASLNKHHGVFQHNGFTAFRNETVINLPEGTYGGRMYLYTDGQKKRKGVR